jgi:eukaryotic-like serine/threonine-protein kinase
MTFLDFIFTRAFWKNLLWIIAAGLVLGFIALLVLKAYTRHGTTYEMPDFQGMMPEEIENHPLSAKFRFEVIDTIFSDDLVRGSIAAQDPAPGSTVKRNRKVFLTLVSDQAEQISMPNLQNLTLRMAVARLETYGLRVGQRVYVPSDEQDAVLGQLYRGRPIEPGTEIPRGSVIDLQVGQGLGYENITIPLLIGMTRSEAVSTLMATGLNLGMENFDSSRDTNFVRIYRQSPGPGGGMRIAAGSPVDVWYKIGTIEEFEALKYQYTNDSLGSSDESFDF